VAEPAQEDEGTDVTNSNTSAWGDDLSNLFGAPQEAPTKEDAGLGDLFGAPDAGTGSDGDLGDLFGAPEGSTDSEAAGSSDLGDLFGAPEADTSSATSTALASSATEAAGSDDLSDLFGPAGSAPEDGGAPSLGDLFGADEDSAQVEASDAAQDKASAQREAASGEEATHDSSALEASGPEASATAVEAPAPTGWRKAPPVLGQSTRPAKEVDFGFKTPAAPAPAVPAPVTEPEASPVVTPGTTSAPEPEASPEPAGPAPEEAPAPLAAPEVVAEPAAPAVEVPVPVAASALPRPSTADAAPVSPEEQLRAAQEFLARTEAAQRASASNQAMERLRAQAELEQAARRYEDVGRLWAYVDRVMDSVSGESRIVGRLGAFKLTRDAITDREQRREFEDLVGPALTNAQVSIPNPQDRAFVMQMAYDEVLGISVLGELWRDDAITEIMVDSWDKISVERDGMLLPTRLRFRDAEHANSVARSLAQRVSDRAVSKSNPLVSAELPRARVQFCYGAVVRGGLSITLRKFRPLLSFEALMGYGSLTAEMAEFLHDAVLARATVLVSGGTGTGKTTIINLLSSFIPDTERVITIEDAFELELSNRNWVPMQTKERSSADDEVHVGLAELLRSTLRMRPDRVIVGEIREPSGAEVMITAANTGHDGTMTTIHANSGDLALNDRLSSLLRSGQNTEVEVARQTISSAFHLVVQVTRSKGKRFISEISVVDSTCFKNGRVTPEKVFEASVAPDGEVRFRRAGVVRADTELHSKLVEAGVDVTKWENI
jgi:pilus assembly protein CpaF